MMLLTLLPAAAWAWLSFIMDLKVKDSTGGRRASSRFFLDLERDDNMPPGCLGPPSDDAKGRMRWMAEGALGGGREGPEYCCCRR